MEYIYIWLKNIVIYAVLVNIMTNLIGSNNYKKYIRLFTGIVMVIIVVSPLTKLFNIDETFNHYFDSQSYKINTNEADIDFGNIEDKQNELILKGYKSELKNQITELVNNQGYYITSLEISIIEDTMSTSYGDIKQINIEANKKNNENKITIDNIKKVTIENQEKNTITKSITESIDEINLKKAISDFYNMSENNINISIQE